MPRISKKSRLRELVAERGWSRIGDAEWDAICLAIPNIAPEDLQGIGIPAAAPWCGVRQHTFDELAESLCSMSEVYAAREDLRRLCRRTVIHAKDRARAQHKSEMVDWMLVWLGDPAVFPGWVEIRRTRTSAP